MTKILATLNQKGGVGKTTTAFSIADALKERGYQVLMIDGDPDRYLTTYLGHENDGKDTLASLMERYMEGDHADPSCAIRTVADGVDYIPSHITLHGVDRKMVATIGGNMILSRILRQPVFKRYDYIMIDLQPSLGDLVINALACCHSVIIPVECSELALEGAEQLRNTLKLAQQNLNPDLSIAGVLITKKRNTNNSKKNDAMIREAYGDLVFQECIPLLDEAESSVKQKCSPVALNKRIARSYRAVVEEFLEREGKKRGSSAEE